MTAGSWIYIGSQGIIQGNMRLLRNWAGSISKVLWKKMGFDRGPWRYGWSAAFAASFAGAASLTVEVDPTASLKIADRLRG